MDDSKSKTTAYQRSPTMPTDLPTELEQLIADELRRIDPQEGGIESKAERIAEVVVKHYDSLLPDPHWVNC